VVLLGKQIQRTEGNEEQLAIVRIYYNAAV
jgi:hypothetical protein